MMNVSNVYVRIFIFFLSSMYQMHVGKVVATSTTTTSSSSSLSSSLLPKGYLRSAINSRQLECIIPIEPICFEYLNEVVDTSKLGNYTYFGTECINCCCDAYSSCCMTIDPSLQCSAEFIHYVDECDNGFVKNTDLFGDYYNSTYDIVNVCCADTIDACCIDPSLQCSEEYVHYDFECNDGFVKNTDLIGDYYSGSDIINGCCADDIDLCCIVDPNATNVEDESNNNVPEDQVETPPVDDSSVNNDSDGAAYEECSSYPYAPVCNPGYVVDESMIGNYIDILGVQCSSCCCGGISLCCKEISSVNQPKSITSSGENGGGSGGATAAWIIVAILVVVVGGGGWFFYRKMKMNQNQPQQSNNVPQSKPGNDNNNNTTSSDSDNITSNPNIDSSMKDTNPYGNVEAVPAPTATSPETISTNNNSATIGQHVSETAKSVAETAGHVSSITNNVSNIADKVNQIGQAATAASSLFQQVFATNNNENTGN